MTKKENLLKGFVKENPIFVFLLGMCPALAVTASFETSLGMGILVVFVLTMSNIVISSVRNFIPYEVRTPAYIVIIATFVTIVRMFTAAYAFDLYLSLGVFIPLIVVNCLILGRAEAYASDNTVFDSIFDGMGMGLGFTLGLSTLAFTRELLGTGSIALLNITIYEASVAASFLVSPPGAFLTLGLLIGIINTVRIDKEKKKKAIMDEKIRIALEKKAAKKQALEAQQAKETKINLKEVALNE